MRYVATRIRRRQQVLFSDGSRAKHFVVVSNRWELKPARLIEWHREKAGTIEAVHDVLKNELVAGVMPSKYFGANAAWLRLAVIAHNVLTALKRIALPVELLRARPKAAATAAFCSCPPPGGWSHMRAENVMRLRGDPYVDSGGQESAAYGPPC